MAVGLVVGGLVGIGLITGVTIPGVPFGLADLMKRVRESIATQ